MTLVFTEEQFEKLMAWFILRQGLGNRGLSTEKIDGKEYLVLMEDDDILEKWDVIGK